MKKSKLDTVLEKMGGRFFTLGFRTTKESGSVCARLINTTANYVVVEDVNTGMERKFSRKSVVNARCGTLAYNA